MYIVSHKHGAAYELPSRTHYTWRSLYVGSDVLSIDYQDPHYCSDCDYIVGMLCICACVLISAVFPCLHWAISIC